ncbi:MAG: helix-turn-helix domain-containing protein [Treponema sp.]|jgi:transcriptional regulator with XRE-family HTH domain|nr:helix-turn-helix domain-containing protein [Treponema sp.]
MNNKFRENLRRELGYQGMTVKELSAKTGIPKLTLDLYLRKKGCIPSVGRAVQIADTLDVTVEYLVTGTDSKVSEIRGLVRERLLTLVNDLRKKSGVFQEQIQSIARMLEK